jgi:hypothetical protein
MAVIVRVVVNMPTVVVVRMAVVVIGIEVDHFDVFANDAVFFDFINLDLAIVQVKLAGQLLDLVVTTR